METCPICGAAVDTSSHPDHINFEGSYITAEWIIHCECGAVLTAQCNYDWDGDTEISADE